MEASLVLEQAWCQEDEEHPNVSWIKDNGRRSKEANGSEVQHMARAQYKVNHWRRGGQLTYHSKNIDNVAANTIEN